MESGPAIFTGSVFALFGAALLGWTAVRVRHREPVALGAHRVASATVATAAALVALALGAWCFTHL
ncbi:hypothetical protein ACH4UM_33465 [Streptomyces sp. NPDC020801]|uniref:hypothetical protein n=1 Tax=unclassified Streptomyces TaxID=2593676 RepID=UPI0037939D38